jgi:hypothetical protein
LAKKNKIRLKKRSNEEKFNSLAGIPDATETLAHEDTHMTIPRALYDASYGSNVRQAASPAEVLLNPKRGKKIETLFMEYNPTRRAIRAFEEQRADFGAVKRLEAMLQDTSLTPNQRKVIEGNLEEIYRPSLRHNEQIYHPDYAKDVVDNVLGQMTDESGLTGLRTLNGGKMGEHLGRYIVGFKTNTNPIGQQVYRGKGHHLEATKRIGINSVIPSGLDLSILRDPKKILSLDIGTKEIDKTVAGSLVNPNSAVHATRYFLDKQTQPNVPSPPLSSDR